MAQALLLATLLSLAGIITTAIQGFIASSPAAIGRHILFALLSVVVGLFAQSMTMFFFIGTGKEIKEKAKGARDEAAVVAETKQYKMKVFPAAMYAMLFMMVTFILGGGVHRCMTDQRIGSASCIAYIWIHRTLMVATIAMLARAYWIEARAMVANQRLMERFLAIEE